MDKTNDDAPVSPVSPDGPTPERAIVDAQPASQLETLIGDEPESLDGAAADAAAWQGDDEAPADPVKIARFVVLRRVGEGGMGVVYAAYDNELDRRVAIKLVRARVHGDTGARIRREAQALARLSHPNVVQVYEVGTHDGQLFVAMEFVTGPTLSEWARALEPGPQRWRSVLDTYIEVGRGLAAAHTARIVHRDFKPANAIVGEDGRVRVLDFGIARSADAGASEASSSFRGGPTTAASSSSTDLGLGSANGSDSESSSSSRDLDAPLESHALDATLSPGQVGSETSDPLATPLTVTGALMGTPAYMSPEQFERRQVDPASDQFSFCVALWEALYGERPFTGRNPAALMVAVLAGDLRSPPASAAVPAWVQQILRRGLETDPDARWPSMEALLEALALDPDARRRRRLRKAGLAAVVTTLVVGSVWFANAQRREAELAAQASAEAQRLEALAAAREAEANAARDRALLDAQASAARARDTARVLAASDFADRPEVAAALLRDVERPLEAKGWHAAALEALQVPVADRVLRGHQGRVVYLDASSTGEWLASSSFDGSARLWSTDPGGPAIDIPHPDQVLSASFDPKGERLLTAGRDSIARVWSIASLVAGHARGELPPPELELRGHEDLLWSAQWSHDGSQIVTASRDGTARVWSGPEYASQRSLPCPGNAWWAEFSPDDRWLVCGSSWSEVRAWSIVDPALAGVDLGPAHPSGVGDVHFSPTNRFIATASIDGKIRLFHHDRETGPETTPYAILDHDHEVFRLRFSRDGLRMVSSSRDRTAKLWTLDESGALEGPARVLARGAGVIWTADISPDGRFAAVGLAGGTSELIPLEGGPPVRLRGHVADVFRVRFAPDGRSLYTGSNDGTIRVWNMDFSRVARELPGHTGPLTVDAKGDLLVTAGNDGMVRLWSGLSPGVEPAIVRAPVELGGHGRYPTAALGGNPHILATADLDGAKIRVWMIHGALIRDPERPLVELELPIRDGVRRLAFDPSGELLAATSLDGHVYLWRLGKDPARAASLEPLELAHHHSEQSSSTEVLFSPDGRTLVSGGGDRQIRVWSTDALRAAAPGAPPPSRVHGPHGSRVSRLAFSPDSTRVASASLGHDARLWTLATPEAEPQAFEHGDMVVDVAFDPSGTLLATASADTKTYLWDLVDGSRSRVMGAAGGEARRVAFSPDGGYLSAVAGDGRLRVWPLEGGAPFELDTGAPLYELSYTPDGTRVIVAGASDVAHLLYLGADLSRPALVERLAASTRDCLGAELRMTFIGESPEEAATNEAACLAAAASPSQPAAGG